MSPDHSYMEATRSDSRWINYVVALALGATFTVILVLITWNTSVDAKARDFALQSSSIKDVVSRNVQTANDTLNSLATFLGATSNLNSDQYSTISTSLLGLHPFMEGAVYITCSETDSSSPNHFTIRYQTMRDSNNTLPQVELLSTDIHGNAINSVFESNAIIALASDYQQDGWKGY